MKKQAKRWIAMLLSLTMVLSLLPATALPAFAAGTITPDGATTETWAQHDVTVQGTDSICENAAESTSGHLHLKAGSSNGKDGGSTATEWPAVFMSSTMNGALQAGEDGNYTVSFKMKFNVVDAFGVFINYTDPSKGFFLGYNNGAWYSQRYGVGGTNWTNHNSSTPEAGTVYQVDLSWNAENHTASFKMQTEDKKTVLTDMTNDSYADLIAVDGIEEVNNFALAVGKYSTPAEIEVWDIHYSGQDTVPAYDVSGKVSDGSSTGLADVEVTASAASGAAYTATTKSDGTYTLELPDGTYTLTAVKGGYITATKEVTVGGADLADQDMTMEVSHTVDIPVDAAEDITNWTKVQGTGAAVPTLKDGRLILMAGPNNHEKLTSGSAAIYTNSTMESDLKAVDGKKWISFKLTPTSIKSNDSFAEDYLGFGITLNYNGQTGTNAKGYYIGFCTHSGAAANNSDGRNHDGLFFQEWNGDSHWANFTLPDGLKSGQEMKFYIEWTDTSILLKINDKEIPLGSNQMTATGENITNRIAFSMGGGNTFCDENNTLQNVTIQTQLTLSDIHYSGQKTEKGHTVAGTVKDDHNKTLSGAVVSAGNGKYTATTDANGKYNMILPEAESAYTVTAELDGYTTATQQVTVNGASDYQVLEATDFTLPLLPVITGKVVDSKGIGIRGATVKSDRREKEAVTDDNGTFTVIGAVNGDHILTISAENYETATKEVTVNGADVSITPDIQLEDRQIPSYTLSTDDMDVKVAQGFPQVIQYTLKDGQTMYGQTAELDTIKINGKDVKPTVTSVKSNDNKKVTYTMVIDSTNNGTTGVTATITAELRVGLEDVNDRGSAAAGRTLGFYITDVTYANNSRLTHPVDTIEIPNHSLVSVRSTEAGAAVTGAKLASNTVTSGDVTYKAEDYVGSNWGGNFFAAFVYNDKLSASLASNSAYGTSSAGSDTYPVHVQFEGKDGGTSVSIGLGSTLWYYDHDITRDESSSDQKLTTEELPTDKRIIAPLETPYAKVVITGDMNDNGEVDWQDGAIAYRETVMHIPVGGEQVANTANLRISMNFGSMATNPFLIALDNVKRVSAHTDGLGQFVLLKGYAGEGHDSNHPQYDNIGIRMGGTDDLKTLLEEGKKLGAAFGIHTNASEFYAEAITNGSQIRRNTDGSLHYGWNWLDQGIAINAVYDYASGLRKTRWDKLYEIVKGYPFTVYVDVWGNNTSGTENDFMTRALSNEILKDHDGWRIAHEWAWANPYESTFQHWTTDYTYGNYSDKGKLNSSVLRFLLNQYKDSFPADFATFGGACNAPLLGGPAMQGFEGWQQDGEYNLSIYNTFNQMIYTKFLQHYSVTEWTDASTAVKMPYSQGANGERSNEADWTPEVQIKLAGGGDEIVVTRGTTGEIMTDETLAQMNTAKGFQANEAEYRSRVVTLNGKVIVTGAPASAGEDNAFPSTKATLKYLIPWYWEVDGTRVAPADEKLYHWNAQGGNSTWELPNGWTNLSSVIVYELSDQGRDTGKSVAVSGGRITLSGIKANTGYVVTKGANANNEPDIKYGTGLHLGDPSFNMDTARDDNPWKVEGKGSAIHTTNTEGIGVLKMTGEVSVSQVMTDLKPGTNYVSYVAVDNRSNVKAKMTITDKDGNVVVTNYTERSIARNYVSSYYLHNNHGMEAGGSYFQNMFVYFTPTAEGLPYTMTLSREAGSGSVYFDDLRTVEYGFNYSGFGNGQTAQNKKGSATIPVEYDPETGAAIELHQDFENVPQGIWPFVVGPVEGVNDNRTHVSELNTPFTQAGWDVKKLDDVIDGNWSIKTNGLSGRNNLVYQTIPQNFRFEPGKVYTVSFDYELGTTNSYQAVVGDGAYTSYDNLTVYPLTKTLNLTVPNDSGIEGNTTAKAAVGHIEFTVVGSDSGQTWIGIYSKNNADNQGTSGSAAAFGGYTDFVLDNLHIEAAPADKQELATLLQQADAMTDNSIYSAVTGTDTDAWTAMTTARTTGHTVFDSESATTEEVTAAVDALKNAIDNLQKVEVSISGTVTNANNKPVEGVILTLENATYFPVGLTATTDANGEYEFVSKSGVELVPGTYHIKAQCTGYNVTTAQNIVVTKADAAKTRNISLVAEAPGAYVNDFNQCLDDGSENIGYGSMGNLLNGEELESLGELTKEDFDALTDSEKAAYLKATVLPTMQWIEYNGSGALKVTWHCNDNGSLGESRYINNVLDKTIAFKNGSASYDVTALTTGVRFNVVLRASQTKKLVTVGQQDSPKNWMAEFWNTDGSGCSKEMTTNVLAVEPGVTRNIRIDASDTTFTVYVDGIQAFQATLGDDTFWYAYSWAGQGVEATPLVDPGYIGINMRYGAGSEFIIDNIRIVRADAADPGVHNVSGTVTTQGGDAISGAAVDLYSGETRVAGTDTNALGAYQVSRVAPGDYTVKVSAPFFTEKTGTITVGSADLTGQNFTLTLDKSSLTGLIDEVKTLKEEDYTAKTWEVLDAALTAAKAVAEDNNATVAALNTAYRDLSNAKEALVISEKAAADFSELRDLHKDMANKPNEGYTADSWDAFQEALEAARQVLLAGTATQGEVDAAKDALQSACSGLVEQGDAPIEYTVTFNSRGGSAVEPKTVTAGGKVEKPADPTWDGYTFGGWFLNEGWTMQYNFDNDVINANTTLYAKWTAIPKYTVTFNSNGGSAVASKTVTTGSKVDKPADPTKSGHTFGGWFREAACENAWNFDSDTVTEPVTLYAKWTLNTYTVTFNRQDGTTVTTDPVNHGGKVTKPADPTKSGHTFGGWYTDAACTDGSEYNFDADVTRNIILYAKWTLNTYTVTFNRQDGTTVTTDPVNHGGKVTKPADPTKSGHTFGGWYTDAACTDGSEYNFDADVTRNIILYAKWTAVDKTALNTAIGNATDAKNTADLQTLPDGTEASNVDKDTKFVTTTEMTDLTTALNAAQEVADNDKATQEQVNTALSDLNTALGNFTIKTGTKEDSGSTVLPPAPSTPGDNGSGSGTSSTTTTKPDGSTTTTVTDNKTGTVTETTKKPDGTVETVETKKDGTVTETTKKPDGTVTETTKNTDGSTETVETKPDGTKTETTEKTDGTVETVETKPDGTKTETTKNTDGTVEAVETKPDGTVTETTEKPDGSSKSVETKPDGTVTATNTDAEGGKVEKVTTPEKDVAITVTDKDGEELAKVSIPAEIPAAETRFVDVPVNHWADEAIHNMAALEVVEGVGNDRFDMNSSMTRGALATVLSRLSDGQKGLESSFADVASDKWYADGIAWAARTGVVTGYSATEFGPNDAITREQLAVMLCRYARLLGMDTTADSAALGSFKDGSKTHGWAADSIAWCVDKGILRGMGNETLAPTATATRAQVSVMLQRFIDLMK